MRFWITTFILLLAFSTGSASADDKHRLEWKYEDASPAEWVIASALVASIPATHLLKPGPSHFTGTNGVDDSVRDFLRSGSAGGRSAADLASTIMVGSLLALPAIDAIGVAWLGDKNPKVMAELLVTDAIGVGLIMGPLGVIKNVVARPRPCTRGEATCSGDDSRRSFFSEHTANAFLGAGLICQEHSKLALWGNETLDKLICPVAIATAAGAGTLRIVADKHYFSDVAVGAAVGSAVAYGTSKLRFQLPFLDSRSSNRRDHEVPSAALTASADGQSAGAYLVGRW